MKSENTNPEVMKVLIALAKNLRASGKNCREKKILKENKQDENGMMEFQARAMHHALYNAFYLAKKAAGRKKLF